MEPLDHDLVLLHDDLSCGNELQTDAMALESLQQLIEAARSSESGVDRATAVMAHIAVEQIVGRYGETYTVPSLESGAPSLEAIDLRKMISDFWEAVRRMWTRFWTRMKAMFTRMFDNIGGLRKKHDATKAASDAAGDAPVEHPVLGIGHRSPTEPRPSHPHLDPTSGPTIALGHQLNGYEPEAIFRTFGHAMQHEDFVEFYKTIESILDVFGAEHMLTTRNVRSKPIDGCKQILAQLEPAHIPGETIFTRKVQRVHKHFENRIPGGYVVMVMTIDCPYDHCDPIEDFKRVKHSVEYERTEDRKPESNDHLPVLGRHERDLYLQMSAHLLGRMENAKRIIDALGNDIEALVDENEKSQQINPHEQIQYWNAVAANRSKPNSPVPVTGDYAEMRSKAAAVSLLRNNAYAMATALRYGSRFLHAVDAYVKHSADQCTPTKG
jgi:hypothetical protein